MVASTGSDAILDRLSALHPRKIDLSLGRMYRLLEALDHPERALPPVIHVAGTNGKGSTIAVMRAIHEASGRKVHVYTSPHLVRFHERIRLGGKLVDEARLAKAFADVEQANKGEPITLFEITTAAAFLLFSQVPADVLLLEVGLGGRLDATNVVDDPVATVITPVSFDHAEYLGTEIAGIAAEKAGIVKPGVPCIVSPQLPAAEDVILERCVTAAAPCMVANRDWQVRAEHGRLVFEDADGLLDLPLPNLPGHHQIMNAGAAIACTRALPEQLVVSAEAIGNGMRNVNWPARMQSLRSGPLFALLPEGSELWIDGGHNESAGGALSAVLADMQERHAGSTVMIAGMLSTKDPGGFLGHFVDQVARVITVPVTGSEAGIDPQSLAETAHVLGLPAMAAHSLEEAFEAAGQTGPVRVIVAGSLYLAGEALQQSGWRPT